MSLGELIQSQQNNGLFDGELLFDCQQPGDRRDSAATIAMLPHKTCRLIEAVGLVPLQVINQDFVR